MRRLLTFILCAPLFAGTQDGVQRTTRSWTDCVNVATGELTLQDCDLTLPGVEPLSLTRFYNSSSLHTQLTGLWRHNPQSYCLANLEYSGLPRFFSIGSSGGGVDCLEEKAPGVFSFDARQPCFFNLGGGSTHPHNLTMFYEKVFDPKNSKRFSFEGKVIDGSGSVRTFSSGFHKWNGPLKGDIDIDPNQWTPYTLKLTEEVLPNGNRIHYSYLYNVTDEKMPTHPQLASMTVYNRDLSAVLNKLTWHYQTKTRKKETWIKSIVVESATNSVLLSQEGKKMVALHHVKRPDQPDVFYQYDNEGRIIKVTHPDHRFLSIEYDSSGRVTTLSGPYGVISQYTYYPTSTQVKDALGNAVTYFFDPYKRITSICRHKQIESFEWDGKNGNLLSHQTTDLAGNLLKEMHYRYDAYHNLIYQQEGDKVEKWRYSQDGRNLVLWHLSSLGKETSYTYLPSTNLVTSILVRDKQKIVSRTFYTYDNSGALTTEIVDDGTGTRDDDLRNVTYRKVTRSFPKTSLPCYGLPLSIEDTNGRREFVYSSMGEILEEKRYDSDGSLISKWEHVYENGCKIQTIDPVGEITRWQYDANHNCLSEEKEGHYTQWEYDLENRVTMVIRDGIVEEERQYDALGRLRAVTDRCGYLTSYDYDPHGNITAIYHPDGTITRKAYDPLGHLIEEELPCGDLTSWVRDCEGRPLEVTHPDGSHETFAYDFEGNLTSHTDVHGATTTYTYNLFGDEIVKNREGKVWETIRTPFVVLQEKTPTGLMTSYNYDEVGRCLEKKVNEAVTHFGYDAAGRQSFESQQGVTLFYSYDALDRIIEKREEGVDGSLLSRAQYRYDSLGNITETITDGIEKSEYDAFGQLLSKVDPLGNKTTWEYLYKGGLTIWETRPNGVKIQTRHNSRGWPVETTWFDPADEILHKKEQVYQPSGLLVTQIDHAYLGGYPKESVSTHFKRGPKGRVEKEIRPGERIWSYRYDRAGRQVEVIKPDGTTLYSTYDQEGKLSRYHGSDFDYHYHYDRAGRVVRVDDILADTSTHRAYDCEDNVVYEKLANGFELERCFDAYGHVIAMASTGCPPTCYQYENKRLKQVKQGPLTFDYLKRDQRQQPLSLFLAGYSLQYTRDLLGRVTSLTTPSDCRTFAYDVSSNLIRQDNHFYEYDLLGQLKQEDKHHYCFDSNGVCHGAETLTFKCGKGCARLSNGTLTYEYDANGNLLTDGKWLYEYDALDRLIKVVTEEGENCFTYDPFHRKMSECVDGEVSHFIWDDVIEIGSPKRDEYRIVGEDQKTLCVRLNGEDYVTLTDQCGSITQLIGTTDQGEISYRPFGQERCEGVISPWRFCGGRVEELSGLVYFGRRYYSPTMMSWLTPDPLGLKAGVNPYAYANNNPLLYTDAFGLAPRNVLEFGALCLRPAFWAVEMTGRHLIPIPGVKDMVESVGRWGRGGGFNGRPYHQVNHSRVHTVTGWKHPHHTLTYQNGILTSFESARNQAEILSNQNHGQEVTLLYNGTAGLSFDLIKAAVSRIGFFTPTDDMNADFYHNTLKDRPHHVIDSSAHSQGGRRLMNLARRLSGAMRSQIRVETFGSPVMVPENHFGFVNNYVSPFDPVPLLSPFQYIGGLFRRQRHITRIRPSTPFPWKEHEINGPSYRRYL